MIRHLHRLGYLAPLVLFVWAALPATPAPSTLTLDYTYADAMVKVRWDIRSGLDSECFLPEAPYLDPHPDVGEFKEDILDEYLLQIPEDVRNSWAFETILVDGTGHVSESSVHAFLENIVDVLNAERDQIAAAGSLPNPPDFSLAGEPDCIQYEYWDSTILCKHSYRLFLDSNSWQVEDATIPATADFTLEVSWQVRIP